MDENAIVSALADRAEVEVATTRKDGTPGWVKFWVVRVDDALFARSFHGPEAAWWRSAAQSGATRLRLDDGEPEHEFLVMRVGDAHREAIDEAYRAVFTGPDAEYVPAMTSDETAETTVRFELAR